MTLNVVIESPALGVSIRAPNLATSTGIPVIRRDESDPYDGPYEVTPSQETQTLETAGKLMGENVIINPVPSNYGRITYNGSVLTVS